ncbi:subtilase-type protease inhibitor [Streptosporangium sp. CA-135522]|uniref:subtilase-type protease inhibitor n=1 Tax=Streptosporangium sp. CA-135522 TaxID=3240072 RepID=UPI003D8FE5EF
MRRLFCLAAAGLFLLSGTAAAAPPPPPGEPGPSGVNPVSDWPVASWPSPDRPSPDRPVSGKPVPIRPIAQKPPRGVKAFVLSIAQGEDPTPATRAVVLVCDPPHGTHPAVGEACEALAGVGGDPGRLRPPPDQACTMQYDPVTVTATGLWNGRFIRYERTFGNACSLHGTTGAVFSF